MSEENILTDETIVLIRYFMSLTYEDKLIFMTEYSGDINEFINSVIAYVYPYIRYLYSDTYPSIEDIFKMEFTEGNDTVAYSSSRGINVYYDDTMLNTLMENADDLTNII